MATTNENDRVVIKCFGLTIEGNAGCAKLVAWLGFGIIFFVLVGGPPALVKLWRFVSLQIGS